MYEYYQSDSFGFYYITFKRLNCQYNIQQLNK